MRSVQKVSSHALWKMETFIEDARYKKHCPQDNDTSVPFKAGTLGPHTVLPIAISCPLIFSWTSTMVWNLFPFKVDFSFGKSLKLQGAKSGLWWGWVGRLPPHWLVQWRHHCSHILHSSPLSLAARLHGCHAHRSHILTMAELFPNRPHSILACQ